MVHTEKGNDIVSLIRQFEQRKIASSRLLICHLDRTHHDVAYHKEILVSGCYFCYDSVRRLKGVSEQMELDYILKDYIPKMKEIGFAEADIHWMCVENLGKILDF